MADWELRVDTGTDAAVGGYDTTILTMPPEFYVTVAEEEPPALVMQPFNKWLRELAESQAATLGERLHHADFVITTDPDVVEARGRMHDCDLCREGVRRALAMLAENPDQELIVGQLYWAAEQ